LESRRNAVDFAIGANRNIILLLLSSEYPRGQGKKNTQTLLQTFLSYKLFLKEMDMSRMFQKNHCEIWMHKNHVFVSVCLSAYHALWA